MSGFTKDCPECMHEPHFAGCMVGEVERLREALREIEKADCCGCSVYGEIATAALRESDDARVARDARLGRESAPPVGRVVASEERQHEAPDVSPVATGPNARKARLDPDGTAKPMTEIVAVMPPDGSGIGKLGTVHTGQATHYVARPTSDTPGVNWGSPENQKVLQEMARKKTVKPRLDPRVVSKPCAAITVTEYPPTDSEREGLSGVTADMLGGRPARSSLDEASPSFGVTQEKKP